MFGERSVNGMMRVGAVEAAQDVFGLGGAEPQRGGVLDHLVVLLGDQFPVDCLGQNGRELRIRSGFVRQVKPLRVNGFEAGQQLETEQLAEGKRHFALPWLSVCCCSTVASVPWCRTSSIMAATSDEDKRLSCE
jgi:hypothetical protein